MRLSAILYSIVLACPLGCNFKGAVTGGAVSGGGGGGTEDTDTLDGPPGGTVTLSANQRCVFVARLGTKVCYEISDGGRALFEGDIELGMHADIESQNRRSVGVRGVAVRVDGTSNNLRWPGGTIPYVIGDVHDTSAVINAINTYLLRTSIRFVPRTTEVDFVRFRSGSICSSPVGRLGGEQFVTVSLGCPSGVIIHELMHTLGFYHTHSRNDRDKFVKIHWGNIEPGQEINFLKVIEDAVLLENYDYTSILHYGSKFYSRDNKPTITKLDGSTQGLGEMVELSPSDIQAIHKYYFTNLDYSRYAILVASSIGEGQVYQITGNGLTLSRREGSSAGTATFSAKANTPKSSGKWYWEVHIDEAPLLNCRIGLDVVIPSDAPFPICGFAHTGKASCSGDQNQSETVVAQPGSALQSGDVLGFAVDLGARSATLRRNGTWYSIAPLVVSFSTNTEGGFSGQVPSLNNSQSQVPLNLSGPGSPSSAVMHSSTASQTSQTNYFVPSLECRDGRFTANFGAAPFAHRFPEGYYPGWLR